MKRWRCEFCRRIKDKNRFCLLEAWDTQKILKYHPKPEHFKASRRAMNRLHGPDGSDVP